MSDELRSVIKNALPPNARRYVDRIVRAIDDETRLLVKPAGWTRIQLESDRTVTSTEDIGDGVIVERWGTRIVSIVVPDGFDEWCDA